MKTSLKQLGIFWVITSVILGIILFVGQQVASASFGAGILVTMLVFGPAITMVELIGISPLGIQSEILVLLVSSLLYALALWGIFRIIKRK